MSFETEGEADRFGGAPHPRHALRLVGQQDQERLLIEGYRSGRLPHAIILGGPAGIGKATLAWRLATFILANPNISTQAVRQATDLTVPKDLKVVSQIAALAHPDIALLRREVNEKTKRFFSDIRADDVRRAIGLFQRGAGAGGFRICIVDSTEDLNRSSANALLKIIEEPPPASLFLLIAHRPGLILPTIRSRARLLMLNDLSTDDIVQIIEGLGPAWSKLESHSVHAAANAAHGSVHDALRLLDGQWLELSESLHRLLDRLPTINWTEVHRIADKASARDGEEAYKLTLTTVYDWLAKTVRKAGASGVGYVAPYADLWEKIVQMARETDALNLDKRPLILSIFSDLATAARVSAA